MKRTIRLAEILQCGDRLVIAKGSKHAIFQVLAVEFAPKGEKNIYWIGQVVEGRVYNGQ